MKTIQFPKLTKWQSDVYEAMQGSRGSGKVFTVKAKRQVGKSILAAIEVIKFAVEQKCTSIVIEPTLTQSRRVYKDIQGWLQDSGLVEQFNASLMEIHFNNGSEIIFKSAEQRDKLRGYTVSGLLVIDEAAFISDSIIDVIFPFVDAHNAPTLVISTPLFKSGRFYTLYEQGLADADGKSQSFDWATYDTSQFLTEEKMEYYRKTVSPIKFTSEYLGQFITDGSYVFKNIIEAITSPIDTVPLYCGIDWGTGQNGDYTAVVLMNGSSEVTEVLKVNAMDAVEQIERISSLINSHPSLKSVTVERNSIGNVFYDMLKRKISRKSVLSTFLTTNESKRQIIENLASAFEQKTISIVDDEEMISELQHYAVEKTQSGKITYNGVFGFHDDIVMALAICYNSITNKKEYKIKIK